MQVVIQLSLLAPEVIFVHLECTQYNMYHKGPRDVQGDVFVLHCFPDMFSRPLLHRVRTDPKKRNSIAFP